MFSDIGSYSCDDTDNDETDNQQRTTDNNSPEKISSQSYVQDCIRREDVTDMFDNIDSLDTSDMIEKMSSRTNVETGSQVARSIISSLFKNIACEKDSLERLPNIDEDCGDEEVEMISGDLKLDRVERLRSSSPSSSLLDPVFQSPKTVERISSWINDLQSDVSFDTPEKSNKPGNHHSSSSAKSRHTKSSFSSRKSDKFAEDDIFSDEEEDDQPSGYTSLMEVSSLEAPETPRLETSRASYRPWSSNHHRRSWSMSPGCKLFQQGNFSLYNTKFDNLFQHGGSDRIYEFSSKLAAPVLVKTDLDPDPT